MWKRMGIAFGHNFVSKNFLLCAVAALFLWSFLFGFSVVRGSSMEPSIHDGDRIVVFPSWLGGTIQKGDVVIFDYPLDPSLSFIKRVVGLPGDRMEIKGEKIWMNGREFPDASVKKDDPLAGCSFSIPVHCFYMLGDNREHSLDSREFGLVREELIKSKVALRVWPPRHIGFIE